MDTRADPRTELDMTGLFEARYVAFLETITHLRPRLHRYCARMTGSALDGEDVMQEAVFEAYRKLETFDESRELSPWLFRIVHNRCIDFLRRRRVRQRAEAMAAEPAFVQPVDPPGLSCDAYRLERYTYLQEVKQAHDPSTNLKHPRHLWRRCVYRNNADHRPDSR